MAWTTPRTWVAGEVLTAALLNTHLRDNLNAFGYSMGAWSTLTETIDQGASADIAHTVGYSKYALYGKVAFAQGFYTMTAGGTAGSKVIVEISGLAIVASGYAFGSGDIYDNSTTIGYPMTAQLDAADNNGIFFRASTTSATPYWGVSPSIALATSDIVAFSLFFETT